MGSHTFRVCDQGKQNQVPLVCGLGHVREYGAYTRAEYLFKQASLKETPKGWTLHQLRHSALTHLAEEGVNLPMLMAKSGHQNLRSLQRYARPGTEAVAAMTAAHDPGRRKR